MPTCMICGSKVDVYSFDHPTGRCHSCLAREQGSQAVRLAEDEALGRVILTTAPSLEGFWINETLRIVSAERVFELDPPRGFLDPITNNVDRRSKATQQALREARESCIQELRREAYNAGGNAVIGVRLDYNEISGQDRPMQCFFASGTAVKAIALGNAEQVPGPGPDPLTGRRK